MIPYYSLRTRSVKKYAIRPGPGSVLSPGRLPPVMRRIYESGALRRDDEDPFAPDDRPQAMRSVDGAAWSRRLLPRWLRVRAISVDVTTPDRVEAGSHVPFVVTMSNTLPTPVALETRSPRLWEWYVDDLARASHVDDPAPDERGVIGFDRGERKRFRRQWDRMFRLSEREWERAPPGEYTIGVGLNVGNSEEQGLYSETTVRIE